MKKLTVPLAAAAAGVMITLALTSMTSRAAGSYADDRSEIEDLQARYLFALDFRDPDLYVSTFTEDGVLDVGSGAIKAREAIKQTIARMPQPAATWTEIGDRIHSTRL